MLETITRSIDWGLMPSFFVTAAFSMRSGVCGRRSFAAECMPSVGWFSRGSMRGRGVAGGGCVSGGRRMTG